MENDVFVNIAFITIIFNFIFLPAVAESLVYATVHYRLSGCNGTLPSASRDQSTVLALFVEIGYENCELFICATQGEIAASAIVLANHVINPYFIMSLPYVSRI